MSYILDALRKADAQRERDPSRGIHAQPVRAPTADNEGPAASRTGFWAAVAAGLAVLAVAGGYLYRDSIDVPAAPPPVQVAAAPAPAPSEPVPPPPATAVLPPPVVVPPAVPAARPAPLPAPAAATVRQVSGDAAPAAAAAAPRRAAASAPAAAASAAAVAVPAAPAAAPPAPAPAAEAASLPAGPPADAPKLSISGGVYSANAAQRMLIVNGQVFNEGAEVSAGLVLEEIRPKAAVLKFRGSRFTVAY